MVTALDYRTSAGRSSPQCRLPQMSTIPLVAVLGSNDIASAVALRLFREGLSVLMIESPSAVVTRRGQAFADAVFDGTASLDGVTICRVDCIEASGDFSDPTIALTTNSLDTVLAWRQPDFLVDARMRKREVPPDRRGLAGLVVGLGPNFVAGRNVDWAVETAWGSRLAEVIEAGPTLPLTGEPKPIGGYGRERYVYSPLAGTFVSDARIGQAVEAGQVVGRVDGQPMVTRVAGIVRGLARNGVLVNIGTKIIEVVPDWYPVYGVGERPDKISNAVSDLLVHGI